MDEPLLRMHDVRSGDTVYVAIDMSTGVSRQAIEQMLSALAETAKALALERLIVIAFGAQVTRISVFHSGSFDDIIHWSFVHGGEPQIGPVFTVVRELANDLRTDQPKLFIVSDLHFQLPEQQPVDIDVTWVMQGSGLAVPPPWGRLSSVA